MAVDEQVLPQPPVLDESGSRCAIVGRAAGEIVAALCLRPVSGGHWLTGLFVEPGCREQGVAAQLIATAVQDVSEPVWLFCHPDLREFYERRGFTFDPALPQAMAERLSRYARSKPMIAMELRPSA